MLFLLQNQNVGRGNKKLMSRNRQISTFQIKKEKLVWYRITVFVYFSQQPPIPEQTIIHEPPPHQADNSAAITQVMRWPFDWALTHYCPLINCDLDWPLTLAKFKQSEQREQFRTQKPEVNGQYKYIIQLVKVKIVHRRGGLLVVCIIRIR